MQADTPCFDRLQVVRDPVAHSGFANMAIDEVLLGSVRDTVLLRLYAWAEPTVSCGYFETAASARRFARGRPLVRRWTGGGIVEHGEDLTYSLCVPRSCAFAALRGAESYRLIHSAVARALRRCGTAAESHDLPPAAVTASLEANACFKRPVLHDLVAGGQKIAGGAQRRNRVGLLHQGSVRLEEIDPVFLVAWKTSMNDALPAALAVQREGRVLTEQETARAHALATSKYATVAWTERF